MTEHTYRNGTWISDVLSVCIDRTYDDGHPIIVLTMEHDEAGVTAEDARAIAQSLLIKADELDRLNGIRSA